MKYFAIIMVLIVLAGCTTPDASTGQASDGQAPKEDTVTEKAPAEEAAKEEAKKPADLEVMLGQGGFETKELSVTKGSRVTIVNQAKVMHKLNGGELFKAQFNTNIKSIYGSLDSLERNKLAIGFVEAGDYEIKDLTSNTILKVTVG